MRILPIAIFCAVLSSAAVAQAPVDSAPTPAQEQPAPQQNEPAQPGPATPPAGKPDEPAKAEAATPDTLRIRGIVEKVEERSIAVQLSQGISLRVDIEEGTPVLSATRIALADLSPGANLRVRTRSAGGGTSVAGEVLALDGDTLPGADSELSEMNARGTLKEIDRSEKEPVLVLSEKGTDRKIPVGSETSYWRLRKAAVNDIAPGVLLSVVIVRGEGGRSRTERAVFGSAPAGALLPL